MSDYDQYYYPNVCHVCKLPAPNLKICKSCKIYRYCSVDHQKIHWPSHKTLCRVLNKYLTANDLDGCFETKTAKSWTQTRIDVKMAAERGLGRSLTASENQIWMFPRACAICNEVDSKKLFDCKNCPAISYCSKEHEAYREHAKFCSMMSLQLDYYRKLSIDSSLSDIIPEMNISHFNLELSVFGNRRVIEFSTIRRSEKLSHVFTILHALKLTGILSNYISSEEKLVIHVIGAIHEYEYLDRQICELLFHWISNLVEIEIIFVGPEVIWYDCDDWSTCSLCKKRKVSYRFETCLYSQYFSSESFTTPNLIVAFNCGFSEFDNSADDTWRNSLPLLMMSNAPLLITSYTYKEALDDFNKLTGSINSDVSYDIVEFCTKNKYSGLLPLRDWINPHDVYYINNYLSIIKKRLVQ